MTTWNYGFQTPGIKSEINGAGGFITTDWTTAERIHNFKIHENQIK